MCSPSSGEFGRSRLGRAWGVSPADGRPSSSLCDGASLVRVAALAEFFRRLVRWWCSATGGDFGGHRGSGGLLCIFFVWQGSLCNLVGTAVLSVSFVYALVCIRLYVRFPYILIYTRFISKKSWLVTVQVLVKARRGQKYFDCNTLPNLW